ncbi:hypothetical protein HG530_000892 [Fusarium avenaceum]|nr:hypothetical protein HG530_000892 [Fusarium avenaceum]
MDLGINIGHNLEIIDCHMFTRPDILNTELNFRSSIKLSSSGSRKSSASVGKSWARANLFSLSHTLDHVFWVPFIDAATQVQAFDDDWLSVLDQLRKIRLRLYFDSWDRPD